MFCMNLFAHLDRFFFFLKKVIVNDSGREVDRVDLSPYNFDGIHDLLLQKGF